MFPHTGILFPRFLLFESKKLSKNKTFDFVEKPPYTPIAYIVSDTNVLTMQLLNKPVPRYYNGEKAEQLDSVSAKTSI